MPVREQTAPLNFYRRGRTPIFASRMDQRFSWCCYVPSGYDPGGEKVHPLAVLVHGSLRDADILRDEFIDFAEEQQCVLLAPLFPAGIDDPEDLHNYKHVIYHGIRYDLILLDMIEELAARYRVHGDKVLMHGFSGGAQFVHRFLYLHPRRLRAVSIGAPGTVTLPDDSASWWVGVKGMEEIFGQRFDVEAMRHVAIQLVIGDADIETWDVTVGSKSPFWMNGINDSGDTRVERLHTLEKRLKDIGVVPHFDTVPGVSHDGSGIQLPVKAFFSAILAGKN
ncbi:alpha/beta hydrolase [Rhizobium terrae]|uniref:alpha/beta hydrolase n=1 Tax=Rhizobium terrae TaxID=2171756 RepID=UPI000E3D1930|nr:alpha/beta hydrolase [Rhizobium terrae]